MCVAPAPATSRVLSQGGRRAAMVYASAAKRRRGDARVHSSRRQSHHGGAERGMWRAESSSASHRRVAELDPRGVRGGDSDHRGHHLVERLGSDARAEEYEGQREGGHVQQRHDHLLHLQAVVVDVIRRPRLPVVQALRQAAAAARSAHRAVVQASQLRLLWLGLRLAVRQAAALLLRVQDRHDRDRRSDRDGLPVYPRVDQPLREREVLGCGRRALVRKDGGVQRRRDAEDRLERVGSHQVGRGLPERYRGLRRRSGGRGAASVAKARAVSRAGRRSPALLLCVDRAASSGDSRSGSRRRAELAER
mmetsp:Transcript_23270/g.74504  ORF Transcript_23270/g.74504 Transcript_23270/m.74504 type:complete len:307 (+) Transcript_23270:200-1120(+)